MKITVIDAQGGGIGKQLVMAIRDNFPDYNITAVGTNSAATAAMLKAGAHRAATGENSVVVASREADIITGPIGIVIADSMLGEITANMAVAIGRSRAKKIFIPVNHCDNYVVGMSEYNISKMIQLVVEQIRNCCKK